MEPAASSNFISTDCFETLSSVACYPLRRRLSDGERTTQQQQYYGRVVQLEPNTSSSFKLMEERAKNPLSSSASSSVSNSTAVSIPSEDSQPPRLRTGVQTPQRPDNNNLNFVFQTNHLAAQQQQDDHKVYVRDASTNVKRQPQRDNVGGDKQQRHRKISAASEVAIDAALLQLNAQERRDLLEQLLHVAEGDCAFPQGNRKHEIPSHDVVEDKELGEMSDFTSMTDRVPLRFLLGQLLSSETMAQSANEKSNESNKKFGPQLASKAARVVHSWFDEREGKEDSYDDCNEVVSHHEEAQRTKQKATSKRHHNKHDVDVAKDKRYSHPYPYSPPPSSTLYSPLHPSAASPFVALSIRKRWEKLQSDCKAITQTAPYQVEGTRQGRNSHHVSSHYYDGSSRYPSPPRDVELPLRYATNRVTDNSTVKHNYLRHAETRTPPPLYHPTVNVDSSVALLYEGYRSPWEQLYEMSP